MRVDFDSRCSLGLGCFAGLFTAARADRPAPAHNPECVAAPLGFLHSSGFSTTVSAFEGYIRSGGRSVQLSSGVLARRRHLLVGVALIAR